MVFFDPKLINVHRYSISHISIINMTAAKIISKIYLFVCSQIGVDFQNDATNRGH